MIHRRPAAKVSEEVNRKSPPSNTTVQRWTSRPERHTSQRYRQTDKQTMPSMYDALMLIAVQRSACRKVSSSLQPTITWRWTSRNYTKLSRRFTPINGHSILLFSGTYKYRTNWHIHTTQSFSVFSQRLKTFLYRCSCPHLITWYSWHLFFRIWHSHISLSRS